MQLVATLDKCMERRRWPRVLLEADGLAYHRRDLAKPRAQRRPMDMMFLMLTAEKKSEQYRAKKWAMDLGSFIDALAKLHGSVKGVSKL